MKKIIIIISFLILVVTSYSKVSLSTDNVTIHNEDSREDFQISIPKDDKEHAKDPVMVTFREVHTSIYPAADKVRLINDTSEEIVITLDEDITYIHNSQTTTVIFKNKRDKKRICKFLNNSKSIDFYLYKTNTLYEVEGIGVEEFRL